ncbi:MAG TPA: hypothetical protein VGD69_30815 [Herpetosiphonaceae bacterium]
MSSGIYARLWVVPGDPENESLDSVTMLLKREGGAWRYLSAGTAFPEDDLRKLGVPQELRLYGESVRGPASWCRIKTERRDWLKAHAARHAAWLVFEVDAWWFSRAAHPRSRRGRSCCDGIANRPPNPADGW